MPKATFFNLPENKRERIIDVSITEFEFKTYREVSVNSIVRESGISKGSFYQYFEDKMDLYQFLIDMMVKEKLGYINEAMANPMDHNFFELIYDTYRSGFEFAKDNPRYVNIGNMLMSDNSSPLYNVVVKKNLVKARQIYEDLIRIGIDRGEVNENINVPLIAHIFSDLNVSVIDYYQKNIARGIDEKMMDTLEELIEFLRKGIGLAEEGV